jgi:hypothetical protein
MIEDSCMFKSIDISQNGGFDAITFGNNKKGKVKRERAIRRGGEGALSGEERWERGIALREGVWAHGTRCERGRAALGARGMRRSVKGRGKGESEGVRLMGS